MSIYGSLFSNLSADNQRAIVEVYAAVSKFLEALGAARARRPLAVGQSSSDASSALEEYESIAESVSGPSIRTALGVDNATPPVPTWDEVTAAYRGASRSVREAIARVRAAYDAARETTIAGRQVDSRPMRAYLLRRSRGNVPTGEATPAAPGTPAPGTPAPVRVNARPRGPTQTQILLAAAAALLLARRRRR